MSRSRGLQKKGRNDKSLVKDINEKLGQFNHLDKRLTRRQAISTGGKAAIGVAVAAVIGGGAYAAYLASTPPSTTAPSSTVAPSTTSSVAPSSSTMSSSSGKTRLDFYIWEYGVQMVQSNAANYGNKKGLNIVVSSVPESTWGDDVVARLSAGTPTDLVWSDVPYQLVFENAGWTVPTEDYWPEITNYKSDITAGYLPGFFDSNGKMTGLAYYGDYTCYLYNERILSAAGIDHPAATWDELISQAQTIQTKLNIKHPIAGSFASYAFWQELYTFMYGIAGANSALFDKNDNPTFNTSGSPLFQTCRWLVDAINKYNVMIPASVTDYDDTTATNTMGAGTHAFMFEPRYDFIGTNTQPQKEAGNIKQAIMPGSGYSCSWMRPYNMTTYNANRGKDVLQAQLDFQNYMGGKSDPDTYGVDIQNGTYVVAKRIAIDLAIGFTYDSLWNDPDVIKAYNSFGDVTIMKNQADKSVLYQVDGLTPYINKWSGGFGTGPARTAMTALLLGQSGTTDDNIMSVLNSMATEWNNIKNSYTSTSSTST